MPAAVGPVGSLMRRKSTSTWRQVFDRTAAFRRSGRGGGFRHDSDLLREGNEARVVLVGAQERIEQQVDETPVLRGRGPFQPFEHLLRLPTQRIYGRDLKGAIVGVFLDEFVQLGIGLEAVAVRKMRQRQKV